MISACVFTVILYHPAYAAVRSIPNPAMRRILMGVAMGVTAVLIIHSPMGKRSGAHFNPAITLTYFRLHKVDKRDAAFYVVFQFIGGAAGVGFAAILLGSSIAVPEVNYAVTVPGPQGTTAAFFAELFMATLLMAVVLWSSNTPALAKYTSYFVGVLIALYILVFAPVSGFSINPARTFGSAVFANLWTAWWIYFIAPPLGMLGVAQIYVLTYGHEEIPGAKPFHQHSAAVGQKEKRAAS
jgi:aquaporin Z